MYDIISVSYTHLDVYKRQIYEYVLKDLNTTAESAIVFEDSMYAINTARSLNIECIGLDVYKRQNM